MHRGHSAKRLFNPEPWRLYEGDTQRGGDPENDCREGPFIASRLPPPRGFAHCNALVKGVLQPRALLRRRWDLAAVEHLAVLRHQVQ
jgi:hypothetical protein